MWKNYLKYASEISESPDDEKIIDQYFPKVKGTKNKTKFHNTVKLIFETKASDENVLEILPKFYKVYQYFYSVLNTLKQKLSEIRKVIEKNQSANAYNLSKYDKYFNLNLTERAGLVNTYQAKITAKNKDKIQVDENEIYEKMKKLITSKNPYERWIALLLATGARPVGLIEKNKFSLIEDKPAWVRVDNLAKKRDTQKKNWTIRPVVLFEPADVIKAIKKLRSDFKNKVIISHSGKLSSDKNDTLNKTVVAQFPWLKDNPNKSSFLRKLYADLAWKIYGDKKYGSHQTFVAEILGHSGWMTSFSYTTVNVGDSDNSKSVQLKNKVDMLDERIKI